jgi:hypothetical protein
MRDVAPGAAGRFRLFRTFDPEREIWTPDFSQWERVEQRKRLAVDAKLRNWFPLTAYHHNDVLYEWGAIVGRLLLRQGTQFGIGGMYIEFENVVSPGDAVALPTVTRDADQGVEYYNALSGNRDYLRVPLVAGTLDSSDEVKFPKGNLTTFFAQTQGVTGVHGLPFSDTHNSKVYGGALVAFTSAVDATQDFVLSRGYLDSSAQQVKLPSSQIGVQWDFKLK